MFAAIGQKTKYLQMPTLPLRLQIPQFTSEYHSRKINRFIYNFTNFSFYITQSTLFEPLSVWVYLFY
jgi:hypothetical protein